MAAEVALARSVNACIPASARKEFLQNLSTRLRSFTEYDEDSAACLQLAGALQGSESDLAAREYDLVDAASALALRVLSDDNALNDSGLLQIADICSKWSELNVIVTKAVIASLESNLPTEDPDPEVLAERDASRSLCKQLKYVRYIGKSLAKVLAQYSGMRQTLFAAVASLLERPIDNDTKLLAKKTLISLSEHIEVIDDLWTETKRLLLQGNSVVNAGLELWLRLVSRPSFEADGGAILCQDAYWALLQAKLGVGSQEQRKFCIAILTQSIRALEVDVEGDHMRFKVSQKDVYAADYAKFATLYRTITVDRFIGQVRSCMADLTMLASKKSLVHPSWTLTLLSSAIAKGLQESVRKIVGMWTLTHGLEVLSLSNYDSCTFIRDKFLPWATQGSFFTAAIVTNASGDVICTHGDALSSLCSQVIQRAITEDLASQLVSSILQFLEITDNYIFAYARAYLLEALLQACLRRKLHLSRQDGYKLVKIASRSGFQAAVQDYMHIQCAIILEHVSIDSSPPAAGFSTEFDLLARFIATNAHDIQTKPPVDANLSLGDARAHFSGLMSSPSVEVTSGTARSDVKLFCACLDETKYTCIKREGLPMGCLLLAEILGHDRLDQDLGPEVEKAISAVWDEIMIQDYPRHLVMQFCSFILSKSLVTLAGVDEDLASSVRRIIEELCDLSQNRIYIFVSLAQMVRRSMAWSFSLPTQSITKVFLEYARHAPDTKIDFLMDSAMCVKLHKYTSLRTYRSYYGLEDSYGHACTFDALNRLLDTPSALDETKKNLETLLLPWLNQKIPPPSFSAWKSTSQLQIILILYEQVLDNFDAETRAQHFRNLMFVLSIELMPRYRYLLEWIIGRLCYRDKNLRHMLFDLQGQFDFTNPKHTVSMIKMTMMQVESSECDESTVTLLKKQLVIMATSAKAVIRFEAQWSVPHLWDLALDRGWSDVLQDGVFDLLNHTIRQLPAYKDPPDFRLHGFFHPVVDHNLRTLLEGEYLTLQPKEPTKVTIAKLQEIWADSAFGSLPESTLVIPPGPPDLEHSLVSRAAKYNLVVASELAEPSVRSVPLQIKANSLDSLDLASQDLLSATDRSRPRGIRVVASLVDSAYNVGGLSRVTEIFGCQSLHVNKLDVIKTKDFTSVAVSSELWLPIEELGADPEAIRDFLHQQKAAGYTIVGIEQTDNSRVVGTDNCKFPEKIVLVIGSEGRGVPAILLAEMDFCVEIPQAGITRSMNVQTAAAVVLYEYSRQYPRLRL